MIIERTGYTTIIDHESVNVHISGNVGLVYEESGLTVVVDSIPVMYFNNISLREIASNVTIELS